MALTKQDLNLFAGMIDEKFDEKFAAADKRWDERFAESEKRTDAKFAASDARMDAKFAASDERMDAKFVASDRRVDTKLETMKEEIISEVVGDITSVVTAGHTMIGEEFAKINSRLDRVRGALQ